MTERSSTPDGATNPTRMTDNGTQAAGDGHGTDEIRPGRQKLNVVLAGLSTLPGVLLGLALLFHWPHPELGPPVEALIFGVAVIGASFILSWAAEVAQLDISAGLAIAVLALIAVLPEYAVSFVFAWEGGQAVAASPDGSCTLPNGNNPCSFVLANMTGANRLLIGIGWPMVVLIAWFRLRRRGTPVSGIELPRSSAVEVVFLLLATLYSLSLPFKRTITLVDMIVLVAIFIAYTVRISKAPAEEPHLIGPAAWIGTFSTKARRATVGGLFLFSAVVILLSAEHFAEGLVETGTDLGINSFFLVQWLAPLASEAPELLVAGLYAYRLFITNGLTTLISSKVNQWTLLIGTLPLVFAIASGSLHGLPVDGHQSAELLLTAAQSLFAVAILLNLHMSVVEALMLLGLFIAQFALGAILPAVTDLPENTELRIVAAIYLVLALLELWRGRRALRPLVRDGFRTPYAQLDDEDDHASTQEAVIRQTAEPEPSKRK
jgi:cation:H+ antiporter